MPDSTIRSPRSPSPKSGSAKLPPLSKFYYGPAQGWASSTEASPIHNGSTWSVNSAHEIPPNLPARLSPGLPAYSPSHWQNTFPRTEEASQGWNQGPLPSAPPPSEFADNYALMPGPNRSPNPGWDSRPTSGSYDTSTWGVNYKHKHTRSSESNTKPSSPKAFLPPRPAKQPNQVDRQRPEAPSRPTAPQYTTDSKFASQSAYDPKLASSRVSATTIDVPLFLQPATYDPETAPPLPQRPTTPLQHESRSAMQSPPHPERLPPPPPKIPLESTNDPQSPRPVPKRPRYDPQNSFDASSSRHGSQGSIRRPQFDPQNSHDDRAEQSQWQSRSQRPPIPTPQYTTSEAEPRLPSERLQDSSQRTRPLQEQLQSKFQDRRDSESRYHAAQQLHQSSISPVGPNDNIQWVPSSSQWEPQAAYVPSPEHQHAVLPHQDGRSISTADLSSNRATLSTPGSQQTSNTSYRDIENQAENIKPEEAAVDSFYWHSGRSSSDADEERSQTGVTAAPKGESGNDQGSSNASTVRRSEQSLPVRSTSLSPTPVASYGASALGFGGPSDWEYFGDYEAEEVDDEELYSRPKPPTELPADYSHPEPTPTVQEPKRAEPEPTSKSVPQLPEKSVAPHLGLRQSPGELMPRTETTTTDQPMPRSQWSPSTTSPTTPHASSTRAVSEQFLSEDQRPDLDDVIRAWSEAPYIGIVSGKRSSQHPIPKDGRELDNIAEASLASTPGERTLGVDLSDAPSIPKLPDSIDQVDTLQKGARNDESATFTPTKPAKSERFAELMRKYDSPTSPRKSDEARSPDVGGRSTPDTLRYPTPQTGNSWAQERVVSTAKPRTSISILPAGRYVQSDMINERPATPVSNPVVVSPVPQTISRGPQEQSQGTPRGPQPTDGQETSRNIHHTERPGKLDSSRRLSPSNFEASSDSINQAALQGTSKETPQVLSGNKSVHVHEQKETRPTSRKPPSEAVDKPRPLVLSRAASREAVNQVMKKSSIASLGPTSLRNESFKQDSVPSDQLELERPAGMESNACNQIDRKWSQLPSYASDDVPESRVLLNSSQPSTDKATESVFTPTRMFAPNEEAVIDTLQGSTVKAPGNPLQSTEMVASKAEVITDSPPPSTIKDVESPFPPSKSMAPIPDFMRDSYHQSMFKDRPSFGPSSEVPAPESAIPLDSAEPNTNEAPNMPARSSEALVQRSQAVDSSQPSTANALESPLPPIESSTPSPEVSFNSSQLDTTQSTEQVVPLNEALAPKPETLADSSQSGTAKAPTAPTNEILPSKPESTGDPYADLDPWGKASLNRFAAMLREEARVESNKDKLNIFNVFTNRESRLRVILYGTDDELILPRKPEENDDVINESGEPPQKDEKGGIAKQPVSRASSGAAKQPVQRTNTVSIQRSLKALPALPAHRESVIGLPTISLAPLVVHNSAKSNDGQGSSGEDEPAVAAGSPLDTTEYSPGGRPVVPRLQNTSNRNSQQPGQDARLSLITNSKRSSKALEGASNVASPGTNAPMLLRDELGNEAQNPAYKPIKYNDGRSEVKNYLTNRRSVYRPFATQTLETMESGSSFDKEPAFRTSDPVTSLAAPRSQYNMALQAQNSGVQETPSTTKSKPATVEQPADMRRFIDADFDPLLMVLPESEPVVHESTSLRDLKSIIEAIPDDFGFIHACVVGWDAKVKIAREESERQRHARQVESEQKIDSLFDDHEIGYGDISELESEFKRSEAARKADEDHYEYDLFVSDVFDLVWTRLHYELDQLYPHYQRYSQLMNDTLAGKDTFEKSEDGLALAPTMSAFLALHQKLEIRHQKAFEAVLERDRRLKKTEISPWYALGNIAEVKNLEKQFEDAEKKAIIAYCQQRDGRANELMDVLDQNTLRGVGANQDYMEAIMKAVRRIASGRAFASVSGSNGPTAGLELVQKAKAITSLLATSSEQIVQTFHVADMLLNSADYEVSVAKAKVAKADMATLTKLKEERAKEDQKLMRDLEHRLALIREDSRRTNDEIVKLMLFLGVQNGRASGVQASPATPIQGGPADPEHEARIQEALEEAKRRNAMKDGGL